MLHLRFSVHNIPDNCFQIFPSSRYPLKNAYKMLSKQQEVLKALFLHAELNIINFDIKIESQAKDLLKTFIHPIDIQISTIQDINRRIGSIASPSFLPMAIKKTLKSAPILPGKIWNISNQMISRIQSQKTEKYKPNKFSPSYRPFHICGRFSDCRSRSQRRGGHFKRRGAEKTDFRQDKHREN